MTQVSLAPAPAHAVHASDPGRTRSLAASPAFQLALAAGLIAAIYGLFLVVPLPVWAGQPVGPPAASSEPAPAAAGWPGLVLALAFAAALCAPYRPYVLALRTASDHRVSGRLALGLTVLLAGVGLVIYPRFGSDIFDYVGYERLWAVYHENPLLVAATSHPSDWSYAFVWFRDRAPAYGPLWALVTWPLVWLAGDSPAGAVAAYKLLSLAGYVAACATIWFGVEPRRRVRALLVFAWSPLVLFEVLGKVHNDGLTALSVVLAVVLAGRGRGAAGLAAGVAGGLVKATATAVAPVVAWHAFRQARWRSLGLGLALAAGMTCVAYWPFWAGPQTLQAVVQQTGRIVWSPGTLLMLASGWLPGGPYDAAVRVGLLLASGAGGLLVMRRGQAADSPGQLATTSAHLLLLGLLLLTTAFYAHYLVPVVALAAVSGDPRLERLVISLSIGSLAAYSVELLGLATSPGWYGSTGYQVLGSLVTLGPAALVSLPRRPIWTARARPDPARLQERRS